MKAQLFMVVLTALAVCACHSKTSSKLAPPAALCAPNVASGGPHTLADWATGAQLFQGLGDYHRSITTSSPQAQAYFDQGLRLTWAFNHDEATRSYVKAGELDPSCAMCWWGAALTLGPNYNVPMLPERFQAAWDALAKAQAAAAKATPVEQALIAALARRYVGPQPLDPVAMAPHQVDFAHAMGEVAKKFPDDLDVQTLYGEALMTSNPWKLWSLDGAPSPGTEEILAVLEGVLAKNPQHPGANHYYIHAVEASKHPEKAVAAAERLHGMMPAAGHLVHMPSHIFERVGRYAESAQANRDAIAADRAYLKQPPPGYYPMYLAHNDGFLAFADGMQGRSQEALAASRGAVDALPPELVNSMPGFDFYIAQQWEVMVRFGRWDAVLAEPLPLAKYPVLTGFARFARGYADAATGKLEDAQRERAALELVVAQFPADLGAGLNSAKDVFGVAQAVLHGRIAQAQGKAEAAIAAYTDAVAREDQLAYDEPADWYFPARHLLGAALLAAGKPAQAEAVYREDLKRYADNGWSLYGLAKALAAQNKTAQAADAEKRFKAAWGQADIQLSASAL